MWETLALSFTWSRPFIGGPNHGQTRNPSLVSVEPLGYELAPVLDGDSLILEVLVWSELSDEERVERFEDWKATSQA